MPGTMVKMVTEQGFDSERSFVQAFLNSVDKGTTFFASCTVLEEFAHSEGRTDIVICVSTGEIFAVEAKLTDWRKGLWQAYRNLSYANQAYILLPPKTALNAIRNAPLLNELGVGLMMFDGEEVSCLLPAKLSTPYHPAIREKVEASFTLVSGGCHV